MPNWIQPWKFHLVKLGAVPKCSACEMVNFGARSLLCWLKNALLTSLNIVSVLNTLMTWCPVCTRNITSVTLLIFSVAAQLVLR